MDSTMAGKPWAPDDPRREMIAARNAARGKPPEERRANKLAYQKRWYREKLGLAPDAELPPKTNGWTAEQDDFVRKNWLTMTAAEIGKSVGRTRKAVEGRARRLKLPAKPRIASGGNQRMHPLPSKPVDASAAQIIAARERMKMLPGPMSKGWRVRSSWR